MATLSENVPEYYCVMGMPLKIVLFEIVMGLLTFSTGVILGMVSVNSEAFKG